MDTLRLIVPEEKYIEGYLQFCKEIKQTGITYFMIDEPDDFEQWRHTLIERYEQNRLGIGIPEGWVPMSSFWLMEGDEFIGACNVRHRLSPALRKIGGHIGYAIRPAKWRQGYGEKQLALALTEAKKLGIYRALVTCADTNTGSARIIEKNGGILQDKGMVDGALVRRYWIDNK